MNSSKYNAEYYLRNKEKIHTKRSTLRKSRNDKELLARQNKPCKQRGEPIIISTIRGAIRIFCNKECATNFYRKKDM